jgi:cobalt-zinc-cadmium efflux system membrane fusion protein
MKIRNLVVAIALFLLCGTAIAWTHLRGSAKVSQESADDEAQHKANPGVVVVGDEKLSSLDIRVAPAGRHLMQDIHVVPGRIQYDDAWHVDIRAAANGILVQVRVMPSDRVTAGQVLAVVSSPEVGLARTEVHHARESWELASNKQHWVEETSKNVSTLVEELQSRAPMNDIEKRFREKTLGKQREGLLSAYSRYLLAENLAKSADTIGRNVLPTTTIMERQAERRTAEAALRAACEQAGFDLLQQKKVAEIETGDALRRLHIAQEQRAALLGYSPDPVPENATAGDVLSRVEIRAPFAGTIEEKHFAQAERVRTSDAIFVLADTKSLWVVADLREQDWAALRIEPGQEILVNTPAMPGCELKARVKRTGRRVVPETNSVSLVAEIGNADGLLRPGLFVQVSIPIGARKDVLCVPAAAVVQHEGAKFVFLQTGPKTFCRADVTTGLETGKVVEIVKGIAEGAPVVVQGAMALKSEMLIETLAKED